MAEPHAKNRIAALRAKSRVSFKWSALGELLSRSLQPLLVIVVGWFVSPAEFGLLAIATIAIGVAQLLQDMGMGKTLIQTEQNVDGYSNIIFWVNTTFSGALCVLILAAAPWISGFFHAPDSIPVLRVLCLRLLLVALGAVHLARLQRELKFRATFLARLLGAIASALVVVPLAFGGHGVWSLVWGTLVGGLVQTGWLWYESDWRPGWEWNWPVFHTIFHFSKWVVLEGLLAAAINWGDSTIVGHLLGAEALGKYRFAANMIGFLSGVAMAPFAPVALSMLSRLQNDPPQFRDAYRKLTRMVCAIMIPAGIGIASTAPTVVPALFGAQWVGTEVVLAFLGAKLALDALFGFNSLAYTAIGRPDLNVKLLALVCAFSLPAYAWSAKFGLFTFCAVRVATATADNLLNMAVSFKVLGVRLRGIALSLWPSLPAALFMGATVVSVRGFTERPTILLFAVQVAVGILTYLAATLILDRAFVKSVWSNIRQSVN